MGRAFRKLTLYFQNIKLGGVKWTFWQVFILVAFIELGSIVTFTPIDKIFPMSGQPGVD